MEGWRDRVAEWRDRIEGVEEWRDGRVEDCTGNIGKEERS